MANNAMALVTKTILGAAGGKHAARGRTASAGATVGATLGSMAGGPVGAAIGGALGAAAAVLVSARRR